MRGPTTPTRSGRSPHLGGGRRGAFRPGCFSGRGRITLAVALLWLLPVGGLAQETAPIATEAAPPSEPTGGDGALVEVVTEFRRPRLGLVLSGGGARGLAHIGVLQALDEAGIQIDAISGNSMGAIIGGLYAVGVTPDSLAALTERPALFLPPNRYENLSVLQKQRVQATTATLYFEGLEWRLPWALVNDFNINWMLFRHTARANLEAGGDFDRLPIPFRAVALDIVSGERVVLREGDLARAIRSSMAIPVTFPPIREPERILVDAGPTDNLPIDLLRDELGAERVVAVDCSLPLEVGRDVNDITRVALRLVQILSAPTDSSAIEGWDVWIEPDLGATRSFDFFRPDSLIRAGRRATRAAIPELRAALAPVPLPPAASPQGRAALGPAPSPAAAETRTPSASTAPQASDAGIDDVPGVSVDPESLYVSWVRLTGRRSSFSWVPRSELGFRPGDRFSFDRLESGLRRVQATNLYESVWPSLERTAPDSVGIVLALAERAASSVGLTLLYDNSRNMNVAVEVSRQNQLRLGETLYATAYLGNFVEGAEGGVRSSAIRGFPLAFDLAFQALTHQYERDVEGAFRRRSLGVELNTGTLVGRTGLLLAGWRFWEDRGHGSLEVPDWQRVNHTFFADLVVDGTDARELPRRGQLFRAEYQARLDTDLEDARQSLFVESVGTRSFGRVSLSPEFTIGWTAEESTLPFRFWHRLDLTRSTWGRFDPDLYAPQVARAGATLGVHLPFETVLYGRFRAGVRAATLERLDRERAVRAAEFGVLQRTPIGPVHLGLAVEENRRPFTYVHVGQELIRRVFF